MVNYKLRKATESDLNLLFNWANDEDVRRNSITNHTITFDEHSAWFSKKINSADCVMFILEVEQEPAGLIRFDYNNTERVWEIGYSIANNFRGKGLSKVLVKDSMELLNKFPVVAYVKTDNLKSQKVFAGLQFQDVGLFYKNNCELVKYIKISFDE
jgi:spore coat polysaccharide biosynthesis protein SpsF